MYNPTGFFERHMVLWVLLALVVSAFNFLGLFLFQYYDKQLPPEPVVITVDSLVTPTPEVELVFPSSFPTMVPFEASKSSVLRVLPSFTPTPTSPIDSNNDDVLMSN